MFIIREKEADAFRELIDVHALIGLIDAGFFDKNNSSKTIIKLCKILGFGIIDTIVIEHLYLLRKENKC